MNEKITNRDARRVLMALAGFGTGKPASLHDRVAQLGFVQVDSVNVLERAHHHILFSRGQSYRPRDLARLIEKDRLAFENWTHDASVIPTSHYPYWRHRFERERTRLRERWRGHFAREGFGDDIARVRSHIADKGPALARDFEGDKPSTGWWDWHPSKAALEYLWRTGELAICRRVGFQKVYDLAERVIPAEHFSREVHNDVFVDWACREALSRLGFASRGDIAAFWALLTPAEVEDWLHTNRHDLSTVSVELADGSHRKLFALPHLQDLVADSAEQMDRVRILSPFDPLLRDRTRAERIFGFHYRIEIFVPEAKRRFGYYVYPVLRGDRAVGRIDVKADRDADKLRVSAFWPEQGVRVSKALTEKLEAELGRLCRLANVASVEFADDWLRA